MLLEGRREEKWVVGVDVGGTFTDFSARGLSSGQVLIHKRPSTPDDPSRAVLTGLRELTDKYRIDPGSIERFAHGTTVATNALLQRKGAKVAVITTKGFRDLLEIGRQVRPHIYDLQLDAPQPLAARQYRFEIDERIGPTGEIVRPLSDAAIEDLIGKLRRAPEIEGLAVCLLFAFLNPAHENRIASALREGFPGKFVSVSSEVQPEFREFERFSTTLINAFLQPEVSRYMDRLKAEVAKVAPNAAFGIFQSSGGLMSVDRASQFPVRTALSGPAAGAVGAAGAGVMSEIADIITLDIGGTSTDVCLIQGGKTDIASMRDISGFRIRLPMVDIHTVGAGGGSIAQLGAEGLMKVGPQSAGAVPGPACYRRGGTLPTVSDANVILGRLPMTLTGGEMTIDRDLAVKAVEPLAAGLGLSVERTALGIVGIVTSNMVRAIRVVTIEKGYDPRKFTLMPFGGAGGLHAADVARSLGISRIIVPHAPGILCAEGLILSDLQEDFVASCRIRVGTGMDEAARVIADLASQGKSWLASEEAEGALEGRLVLSLDMRYVGQNYELPVEIANGAERPALRGPDDLKAAFFAEYQRSYGHYDASAPIEIVNVRLRAVAKLPQSSFPARSPEVLAPPFDTKDVWFDDSGPTPTPMYDRAGLPAGTTIEGPAIITQLDSTTVVPPRAELRVDAALNMIMEMKNA
ncbi:hydantoinase/oxoprolinase family protein [Bradyrhizobium canariense]|uniref:hydantoinase/oxoprolinase family protein n=1 Tax=Bradyrhizobium canariense TaxID=255045 RepID=UPI001CA52612|nr:hydantoinase/oxoprolinase family protein [Bradyrhizobium canariense]MBW5434073.1 hydantoinase/oxoprolinase family protein [Bradyrhizobium canariense]